MERERVIIDDKQIVECKSKTAHENCDSSNFEIERTVYSPEDPFTFYNKIRKAFERHMYCIGKENTTGVTEVEVKNIGISEEYGMYKYNMKGTRYALAVLRVDCSDFIKFNKKVDSVSVLIENYIHRGNFKDYRILSRVPFKDCKDAYKYYCNQKWVLSMLEERGIPSSAAWVHFRKPNVENREFEFIDDYYVSYVSGTICGLGIVYMFACCGDDFTTPDVKILRYYEDALKDMKLIKYSDNLFK